AFGGVNLKVTLSEDSIQLKYDSPLSDWNASWILHMIHVPSTIEVQHALSPVQARPMAQRPPLFPSDRAMCCELWLVISSSAVQVSRRQVQTIDYYYGCCFRGCFVPLLIQANLNIEANTSSF
ncbi:6319_t:CDS:2, partial [Paraglomus brasilianum]